MCAGTGCHPLANSVTWHGQRFPDLLQSSIDQLNKLFVDPGLPTSADRLSWEITRRIDALRQVGLGYLTLDRPSPTLSRGESQRVRLAISLTSRLEDLLHILDEPTIGQHPADVMRFLPAFRDLPGPVIYVEHDRVAAAFADNAIDLGPGAGVEGGEVTYTGSPADLWETDTPTGRYFSQRKLVQSRVHLPPAEVYISLNGASLHNLKEIDIEIPIGRLTVITGVSGSGKSTLVEHILFPSLKEGLPIGCSEVLGPPMKPVLVDQSPIGRNPRSNPATYTKLAKIIRDLFAEVSGLSTSHFSFNRPEGACQTCKGMGAMEVKMRYLYSYWIPCDDCEGQRFNPQVLAQRLRFGDHSFSIAEFYSLSISKVADLLRGETRLTESKVKRALRILHALADVGLGYLSLGQPSPTLSGGEAQRVKLTR